jgi:SSS family transporter
MSHAGFYADLSEGTISDYYKVRRCNKWTTGACTDAEADKWDRMGQALGFTDFVPSFVNWNIPTPWRGDSGSTLCSPEDQSGCPMPIAGGYAIVFGFGVLFTVLTVIATMIEARISTGVTSNSEHFNTAGRNIKTGLTASVIVSQWTWAATLLQSSNKAWGLGVSGPYWYAAGATVQVLLFGIIAIEIKRKCPNAHTFLEIVDARWGKAAHITFLIFGFFTNFLVTGMLLLGGGAVLQDYAGMNKILASYLIPLGVVVYTVFGGLKATFLAGYLHTCVIMCGLAAMVTCVYMVGEDVRGCEAGKQCNYIGSAGAMYERLMFVTHVKSSPDPSILQQVHQGPVATNQGGSYLTMMSGSGLMFGVINTVGNFGTVFVDQSYWQSAIAASPAAAHKGYLLGGLVWFTIPFALATSLGLAGVALNGAITGNDANAGLVPPAAATMLMGPAGGSLMIIMLFFAIASTGSAECIAVSSLVVYDIYRKYFNPNATNDDIMKWSRVVTTVFGIVMGTVAAIFAAFSIEMDTLDESGNKQYTGLSMGWVYVFMGNMIGSAVGPVALAILWKDANKWGAIVGAWFGLIAALASWMIVAGAMYGKVTYWTLFKDEPLLVGNLVAILSSLFIHVVSSLIWPQNYDWSKMNEIITLVPGCAPPAVPEYELSEEFLQPALKWIWKWGGGTSLFLLVVWPMFFGFPFGVMPKGVYAIWVAVAFTWGWAGTLYIVSAPMMEYWPDIKAALFAKPAAKATSAGSETATA